MPMQPDSPAEPTMLNRDRRIKRGRRVIAAIEDRIANFHAYRGGPISQHDAQLIMEALVLLLKDRFGGAE